ncbi:MAG: RNA polymerase sigma factor [Anaerolineales bacterium]
MDESTLIRRAANGDAPAWEPLMIAHQQAVFRFAYLLLGDADDAEDIAQETFLRAWKHLKRFDSTRPLRPWLLSIAANLSSNRRRSVGRYVSALMRAFREQPKTPPETVTAQNTEAADSGTPFNNSTCQTNKSFTSATSSTWRFLKLPTRSLPKSWSNLDLNRALEKLRKIIHQDFPVLVEGREA